MRSLVAGMALGLIVAASPVQGQSNPFGFYDGLFQNYSFSAGVNNIGVDFDGVGGRSGNTGIVCGEVDFFETALRYAGEFGGFRVAAGAGICHGIGSVSAPLGGFTAHADINLHFTGHVRISYDQPGQILVPYVTAGVAFTDFNVAAAPFEFYSGFRPGAFVGVGVEINPFQGRFRIAENNGPLPTTRVFFEYQYFQYAGGTLSGGLPFDTSMEILRGGVRVRR
jgi:hypothetical protein